MAKALALESRSVNSHLSLILANYVNLDKALLEPQFSHLYCC